MANNVTITLPNSLTFLRILLTPVFLFLFISNSSFNKQLSLIVFIFAALTDWYDGWVARKWGYVSRFGVFFDPLADKILSSAAIVSFAVIGLIDGWMVWIIVCRDIAITILRSIAEYKDQPVITSSTAKTKTFVQYVVIYYILILYVIKTIPLLENESPKTFHVVDNLLHPQVLFGMMLLVTFLTAWTGIVYIYSNKKFIVALYG